MSDFFKSRWVEEPAGRRAARPCPARPRLPRRRRSLRPQGRRQDRRRPAGLRRAEQVSSALLLTRNASAAAPVRVCRQRVDGGAIRAAVVNAGNANAETGEQGMRGRWAMCEEAGRQLGLAPEAVAVAETGVIGVPLPIETVLPGIGEAAGSLSADGGGAFADAILTTDRWPKRCTLRAGGVTLSAQAKGAGMMQPDFATMLCFVQTDAVVEDADAALRAAVDLLVRADHRRRPDEHQRHRAAAGHRRGRRAAARRPARRGAAAAGDRDRRRRRGRGPGRPGAGRRRRLGGRRPSGSLARSPTRRWSRRRCSAATRTGAGSPRRPGWRWPERTWRRSAPTRSTPPSWPKTSPKREIGLRLDRGEHSAHVWFSDLGYEYVRINAEYTT